MSWDLYVQELPEGISSIDEIPDTFRPDPICTQADLVGALGRVAPGADVTDPTWIRVDGAGFSIEVNASPDADGVLSSFALHVRGGEEAVGLVAALLDDLGVRALDPQSDSGIFDPATAHDSLARWREYVAQVTGPATGEAE